MTIPKIIHHISPKNRDRWHPLWDRCYPTWKKAYPDFEHKLWNDEEDIDNLIKDKWPEYWDFYNKLPVHIMKIEIGRLALLYHYGGFYVDMDVYCYRNFYQELKRDLYIMEAPFGEESLENALMISSKNNPFWLKCMNKVIDRYKNIISKHEIKIPFNDSKRDQYLIIACAGPNLVSIVFRDEGLGVKNVLPGFLFNNHGLAYHPEFRTKHLLTGLWGGEAIDKLESDSKGNYKTALSRWYIEEIGNYADLPENLTLNELDLYKDYTKGRFLTQCNFNPNKVTDIEEELKKYDNT